MKYFPDEAAAVDSITRSPLVGGQTKPGQGERIIKTSRAGIRNNASKKKTNSHDPQTDSDDSWEDEDELDMVNFQRGDFDSGGSSDEFEIDDSHLDPDDDDEFEQILHISGAGKASPDRREIGQSGRKASQVEQKQNERAGNEPTNRRKKNRAANLKKLADFRKQEAEIFSADFNLAKAKTIKHENFDNPDARFRKGHQGTKSKAVRAEQKKQGYQNTAARAYDDAPAKDAEFDLKREKRISNKVFTQGKGKIEHRKKEREAKERREMVRERALFPDHISDKDKIAKKLEDGVLFEGVIRFNPKFRQRAFLTVEELKVDVMIEGQTKMNRSLDGDKVLVELDPVKYW